MLVRYSDWKKPTDEAYAFRLRPVKGALPPPGSRHDIREVLRQVLEPGEAERFEQKVERWTGPEDVCGPDGERPYEGQQLTFEECGTGAGARADGGLLPAQLDAVLRGCVLVFRHGGGGTGALPNAAADSHASVAGPDALVTDYVLRDHHTLDVVAYHYWTTGALPTGLFHADRHSDWCKPTYLDARVPQQAATWWALLEGFKRPGDGSPLLRERDVCFTTAQAPHEEWMSGRDVGAATFVPGALDVDALGWEQVLSDREQTHSLEALDWVSLDLDYFMPSPQLAVTRGLLRDARFHSLMARARVRLFVLSPQFIRGGERLSQWTVQGGLHSSLRLLNLLRRPELGRRLRARPSCAAAESPTSPTGRSPSAS